MDKLAEAGNPSTEARLELNRVVHRLWEHQLTFICLGVPLTTPFVLIAAGVILAHYYIFLATCLVMEVMILLFIVSNYAYLLRKLYSNRASRQGKEAITSNGAPANATGSSGHHKVVAPALTASGSG
jgi:hypothetical protein